MAKAKSKFYFYYRAFKGSAINGNSKKASASCKFVFEIFLHKMVNIQQLSNYYYQKFGSNFQFMTYRFRFESLFRGRSFPHKDEDSILKEVSEFKHIWAPCSNMATKQRCNEEGNPILYITSHISTIPYELEIKKDDLFVVCEFEQLEEFVSIKILGWEKLMEQGNQEFSKIIENYFSDKPKEVITIDKKIAEIFTSPRLETGEDIYNHSIALSKLYFQNGGDGLIYPSVADGFKSINLALIPDKVKSKLIPKNISIYKLLQINSNKSIDVKVFREGFFDKNLKISWSNPIKDKFLRYEKNVF